MDSLLANLVDRYLYPDQIVFGHLFNPNIKSQYNYQLSKSSPQQEENNQLIIYHKQMSKTKIDSMIQMMNGQHPPLFKSSILPKTKNYQAYQNSSGQQSYSEQEEDYEDYDDQMYMMEKDYQGYFDDQYDQQENPIMAMGQNVGVLPKMKNYAPQFHYQPQINNKKHIKHPHHQLSKSHHTIHLTQPSGLGASLLAGQLQSKKNPSQTKQQKIKKLSQQNNQNESQQQWQTQSQEEEQQHYEG